jgi:site-specific DNA-cytosine methylase
MSSTAFVDLFAGSGGFSLGLLSAGWEGVLAIEKAPDAFRTFSHNLLENNTECPQHEPLPRVHTIRKYARLQSFPDWFAFQGKFTTGGNRRKADCPRYTQVGNAVPPLLDEAVGDVLLEIYEGGGG